MLTTEKITADPRLSNLDPAVIAAIAQLSKNDEEVTIGAKVREIHTQYDEDIESVTGLKKERSVKTYDHLRTVLSDLKEKATAAGDAKGLQSKIAQLETEREDLKKQLKAGAGDAALKSELASLQQKLNDKNGEIKSIRETFDQEKTRLSGELEGLQKETALSRFNSGVDKYLSEKGVKFKSTIPESILNETIANRKAAILAQYTPDMIDDGKGGKKQVYRDAAGEIVRNSENGQEPFTAGELVFSKLSDLVDEGRKVAGAGTKPSKPGAGSGTTFTMAAKTQVEANSAIQRHIIEVEGIAKTSSKFQERQSELVTENNVMDLPLR